MNEAGSNGQASRKGRGHWYDPVGILVFTLLVVTFVAGLATYLLNESNLRLQDEVRGLRTELEAEKEKKLRFLGTINNQANFFTKQAEHYQHLLKECGCAAK